MRAQLEACYVNAIKARVLDLVECHAWITTGPFLKDQQKLEECYCSHLSELRLQ